MKKSILFVIIPLIGIAGFTTTHESWINLVQVRTDPWPINLYRIIRPSGISYALEFRDEQVLNGVLLDTLAFANLEQLKYLGQGLSALKKGTNGDIANYKDYSIKRTDIKKQATWYLLRFDYGLTNFQQPEADKLIETINTQ